MSLKYANTSSSTSWTLKCTDLAQFDALQAAAESFRYDDKLHLRNLCNDTSRCAGLTATHTVYNIPVTKDDRSSPSCSPLSSARGNGASLRPRSMILDYSRQRVTGETMELLFDLVDAVALTDRREAMRWGASINTTGKTACRALCGTILDSFLTWLHDRESASLASLSAPPRGLLHG